MDRPFAFTRWWAGLFDFCFFEFDVLADHRVIFFDDEFFRHGARILFGHIEIARARGAFEFDLDRCWLRHLRNPQVERAGDVRAENLYGTRRGCDLGAIYSDGALSQDFDPFSAIWPHF